MASPPYTHATIPTAQWSQLSTEIRLPLLRSDMYRAVGWSFLFPDDGVRRNVLEILDRLRLRAEDVPPLSETLAALRRLNDYDEVPLDQLRMEFDRIFGHTISAECPPYETQYTPGIIFAQTQKMGDIAGFYRAFGVRVSSEAHERPDHIAAEFEFMSMMTFREAIAMIDGNQEHLDQTREAEAKFLGEHLAPWTLSFAERLARKARAVESGFYEALALGLRHMIQSELHQAQITPADIALLEPAAPDAEPEGCCFSCGAAGEPVLVNLPGTDGR